MKTIIGYATRCCKTSSERVAHKAGEFTGNKNTDAVTKSSNDNIEKQKPVEEAIIPRENKDEILSKLRKILSNWNTIKYLNF